MPSHPVILSNANLAICRREETGVAQHRESKSVEYAVELLKENGFDGLAEAFSVLMNAAISAESGEGTAHRAMFNAPDQEEAEHLLGEFLDRYSKRAPKLSKWAEEALPQGFTV